MAEYVLMRLSWQLLLSLLLGSLCLQILADGHEAKNNQPTLCKHGRHVDRVLKHLAADGSELPEDGHRGPTTVRIHQRTRRAPIPELPELAQQDTEEAILQKYDEVTVEWRSELPVTSLLLRLPERQKCSGETGRCAGFEFFSTGQSGCKLRKAKKQVLPSNTSITALDVVTGGRVGRCTVVNDKNQDEDPQEMPERSAALLQFHIMPGHHGSHDGWKFFTVLVRNPHQSPKGNDTQGHAANSFQVVLNSTNGTIDSHTFRALGICNAWVCGYSDWTRPTPCTAQCGGGHRLLTRRLLHPPPPDYDPELLVNCLQATNKTESCNVAPCAVDCELGDWVADSDGQCTRSCGGGVLTERRPVILGPLGGGKPCPRWNHPSRVRYKSCNIDACPERCEKMLNSEAALKAYVERYKDKAGGAPSGNGIIAGSCSQACGGGKQRIILPSYRKDNGSEFPTCAIEQEIPCNTQPCRPLNFQSARSWEFPEVGKWYLLSLTFVVKELAESLILTAPYNFQLAATGEKDSCFLVEHNLPQLTSCQVMHGEASGRRGPHAILNFSNPLEPHLPTHSHEDRYSLRFWVRHPEECSGGIDAVTGLCQGKDDEHDWEILLNRFMPEPMWEIVKGSYEIYKDAASARAALFGDQKDEKKDVKVNGTDSSAMQKKMSLETLAGGHLKKVTNHRARHNRHL
eukprot:TRINITY_DN7084_c0_g1_i1.p1 TRINITY_DN7084_c0_g1~~TRINITY_DN7084_c0_g1_i1.p1  ORF type:complete len:686 (-),score=109.58 TRINITY_DN7084_c0_g1_i1:110-2167(-)